MWYLNILNISQKSKKGNGKGGGGDRKITSNGRRPAGTTRKGKANARKWSQRENDDHPKQANQAKSSKKSSSSDGGGDLDINKDDLKTMVQHHML